MNVDAMIEPTSGAFTAAVDALRARTSGEVLTAADTGYDAARSIWNAMTDRRPLAIVRCKGVADVIDAVAFARDHRLPVSIRSGGHNIAGNAVGDGSVNLDLRTMRAVRVDPVARRARVEGGATWGDLDRETGAFSLATPGGLVSTTGIAGLTLAGGIGWLRGPYGLCIDNLVSADVVTADGRLLTASADANPDLFWALRGGGGNFGVVTSLEFALHPVGPAVMFSAPIYPISAGSAPIRAWRDFIADTTGSIGSICEFSTVPDGSPDFAPEHWGKRVYTLASVYAGDADEGERLLQPLRELGPLVADFSSPMPYTALQKAFDALFPHGKFLGYWKSHYLSGLPDALIDQGLENAATAPSDGTYSSFWNFGGATAAVPADATALGDRSMPWIYSIDACWTDPAEDAANAAWVRAAWDRAKPFSHHGRLYLNFLGEGDDNQALVRQTYGANYARLAAIKAKYDPGNMFRFNQNIVPAA